MNSRLDITKFTKSTLRPNANSNEPLTCGDLVPTREELEASGDRFLPLIRGSQLCGMSREGESDCKVEFTTDDKIACVKSSS